MKVIELGDTFVPVSLVMESKEELGKVLCIFAYHQAGEGLLTEIWSELNHIFMRDK